MLKKKKTIFILLIFLVYFITFSKTYAMTIVLDTGHGASDPGAINGDLTESSVTHKIGNYLKAFLEKYQDVRILMTNTGKDEIILFDRAMIARNNKADLLVSLHINSSTVNAEGAEIYVTANTSLDKYNKECTELANKILKNLEKLGIKNRGVKLKLIPKDTTDVYSDGTRADYMGIIRYAMRGTMIDYGKVTVMKDGKKVEVPASASANVEKGEGIQSILVEHCFIQGSDVKFIDSDEDIKKLAEADGKAIVEHYGLKLKETTTQTSEKDIKIDEKNSTLTIAPAKTESDLKKFLGASKYTLLDKDGKSTQTIATGGKIKIDDKTYSIIKMGDIDGNGRANSADALSILKYFVDLEKIEGNYLKAADVTKDGRVNSNDALAILKYMVDLQEINL